MPIYEYKGQQYDIATDDAAAAKAKILNYLGTQKAPTPTPAPAQGERTLGEAVTDVAAPFVSGAGKLIQFPGQLYGLATGAIGEEDFGTTGVQGVGKAWQDWAEAQKSPELKRRAKATEAKVKEAEKTGGQWEGFKTQFLEVVKDPAQLGAFLAEQVPASIPSIIAAMVPGAGPALSAEVKALQVAAQAATTVAAKQAAEKALGVAVKNATESAIKRGTAASVATGAVQQGTDVGAETFEKNYKYLIAQGVPKEEAAAQVINTARAAGVSGAIISLLAQKLPGAQAMERALAGEKGKVGRAAGIALGAIKEAPGEMLEESGGQFTQNLAAREFNPEQSLTEGLGRTAALAGLGGGTIGGVVGGIQSGGAQAQPAPAQPAPPEQTAGMQTPEQKAQILRPLEEIEKDEVEQITQSLIKQNFPEDSSRRIAAKRVLENRKRQAKEAVLEPAQNEVEQRVKDLIDAGVDPKLASIQAPEQIKAEKEADALAESQTEGATNVGQPNAAADRTGNEVPSPTDQGITAAGVAEPQRDGMVSPEPNVAESVVGKAEQPATVVKEGTMAAADVKTKRAALVKKYEAQGFAPADAAREADVELQQETPTEVVAETPTPDEQAALQAELDEINNAPVEEQEFIAQQVEAAKEQAPTGKRGRTPEPPEVKAAKEGSRKTYGKGRQSAKRAFDENKDSAVNQLAEANVPLNEGEFENEEALAQAQEDKRALKASAINKLLDIEESQKGRPLGKKARALLNDRTKISQTELDKVVKGREVRKKTDLKGEVKTNAPLASRRSTAKADTAFSKFTNGAQALTHIIKTGNLFQKFLAKRIRPFVAGIKFVVIEQGDQIPQQLQEHIDDWENSRGLFFPSEPGSKPTVYVRGASFGQDQGINAITVLHELLHAATNAKINLGMIARAKGVSKDAALTRFIGDLTALMENAKVNYERMLAMNMISPELRVLVESAGEVNPDTGEVTSDIFELPQEFLAYGMSDENFQDFLDSIEGKSKEGSGWSRFTRMIANLFGLGRGNYTALSDLMHITDKIISTRATPEMRALESEVISEPSAQAKEPEEPVPSATVLPDELKDPVRSAAELKKDAAVAKETVAASREGEEGKGIEMMQLARDPEKALPILQALVKRNWQNMTHGAIAQLVKMPTMTFLAKWSGIKSLQDVDVHLQSMLGMSNSLQAGAGSILASLKKELNPLFRGAKEFRTNFENLVYETTVAQIDPSNPKAKERNAGIDALWKSVGPKGQEMYRNLKQYYENLIDLYSDLLDQQVMAMQGMAPEAKQNLIKVLRQTFETGARITPYFPLVRRGNYWLRVSEKVGKETKEAFYMFESVGERNQRAAEIAASRKDDVENMLSNGTFDMGDSISTLRAKTQGSSAMLTQIFDAIDQEKFDSPQAKEALKDAIYQVYLNTMPEQKFRGQFIHRKDRAGFSTDVLRNVSTTASSTSMHLAKLKYSPLLRNSLSAARDAVKGNSNLSPFVDEAQERVNLALEGDKSGLGDAVAGIANKASFFWFLSGASSALIQPASVYISALPVLAANHNNAVAAGKELAKMMTYINQYSTTRENPDGTTSLVAPSIANNTSLSENERNAIREMSQRGVTQSTYASEVYGYKSIPTSQASTVLGKTKELGKEAADLLVGSLMHNTERLTREAVYLASYRLGVKRGLSHDAAINQAVNDVNESLGNYDVTNRPRYMQQGIGKVLTQFKMFPLHVSLLMCTNFVKMLPLLNKEGKKAAATKFFGTYLTAGSIAGLAGIPAFTPIIGAVAYLFKELQDDEDWPDELKDLDATTWFRDVFLQEKLGDIMVGDVSLADLIDSGPLNALTGSAIAERIGLNDLWGRDTKEAKTSREGMLAYILDKMGPSVSLGLSAADAFDAFAIGDDAKAWDKLAPAAARNIRFAMRMADEGIKDSKGNVVVPPDEISTGRLFAQVIGFRPAEMARIAEAGFKLTAAEQRIVNEKNQLILSAKVAIRKQNDEGFDAFEKIVNEKMDVFNMKHPTYAIFPDELTDQIVEDMETRAGARLGFPMSEKNAVFAQRVLNYLADRVEREEKARKK